MQSFSRFRCLLGVGAFVAGAIAVAPGVNTGRGAAGGGGRAVSYLREVRPILAQHCYGCHGPDEAARKGKLRLDRKDQAFAQRHGKGVIAPGNLDGSLVWGRFPTPSASDGSPLPGRPQPSTKNRTEPPTPGTYK